MTSIDLSLPYLTAALPGIGGQLRATTDFFIVEEVPLYEPSGEGQHLYVNLTKSGLTTKDLQVKLERLLQVARNGVGFAGLKDKYARTTQTMSIPVGHAPTAEAAAELDRSIVARIEAELPVTVHWAKRHGNKLKPGHLLGNRFQITVTDLAVPLVEAQRRAEAIAQMLCARGVPNFFGAQRFGIDGANVEKGLALVRQQRRERNPWLRKFLISAYQSYLTNRYLTIRMEMGKFDQLMLGDVAKKHETGGMFDVEDPAAEQPRYDAHEISFTAPLFGAKLWAAKADAGALEAGVQAQAEVTPDDWRKAKVDGTRRFGRILLPEILMEAKAVPEAADALAFTFVLPKGSFATVVLRELMKVDFADVAGLDSDAE
ncbi:MAG: tRNA pseudouridine(13) synthase TruD [Caldilineaceae bacterium]|nr:tRNA pseudouridine(13) synthase TruD [Caldilineaceae bacterium]